MVTPSDFLQLPYTPDLSETGAAYACRSLAYAYDWRGGARAENLRQMGGGIAVQLALRRYLIDAAVPHEIIAAAHFTEPDRYDIVLGGRRCDVKTLVIDRKPVIKQVRRNPGILLDALALVATDQIFSDNYSDEDILIFSFLNALVTLTNEAAARAFSVQERVFMLHPLPERWSQPQHWGSLGPVVMKTDLEDPIHLFLGGQLNDRQLFNIGVDLPPRKRVPILHDLYAVNYVYALDLVGGRIGIHSPVLQETYIVQERYWSNIWLYGMEIWLVGYMTRGEFRRQAVRGPVGGRVFQSIKVTGENMAVPVANLRPLGDLFARAQNWRLQRR